MIRANMIQRCNNVNNKSYGAYGGRGVFVCRRWAESLDCFIDDVKQIPNWSSKDRDPRGWSLDKDLRNPGELCYSPENCMWLPISLNTAITRGYLRCVKSGRVFLSQRKAAENMGVSRGEVIRMIKGSPGREPSMEVVTKPTMELREYVRAAWPLLEF